MREELEVFAKNLRLYMHRYGYNNITLGKAVGNAPSTVSEWCHAKKFPRLEKLQKLTELFHCEADDLINEPKTNQTILEKERFKRLQAYFDRLNPEGAEKALQYLEDLNPKYFKETEQ